MGNSSSKQPPQEDKQADTSLASSDSNAQPDQLEPQSQDNMQQDTLDQPQSTLAATGDSITQSETSNIDPSSASSTLLAPSITTDDQDTFKIPSLPSTSTAPLSPNSTSLQALPADIEHILSLGANEDQLLKAARERGQGEVDQVVKELREKYAKEGGQEGELSQVEQEMKDQGIVRIEQTIVKEVVEDDKMDQGSDKESSSSSSDSDSSSLESDSTSRAITEPKRKQRTRRKPRAASHSGSDSDDSESGAGGGSRVAPKTEHELEPEVQLPEVMKIEEGAEIAKFGKVESVIETVVVVKADTAGDWRVLDEGTVVCWEDRTVIGTIFETFGSVQQPFYSLRFPPNSAPDPTVFTLQKPVFYAPSHAQFVFTRDLRSLKGSDASNVWDEEVAAAEIEFSDDEEEAEYKKRMKAERRNRTQSSTPAANVRQQSRQPSRQPSTLPPPPQSSLPSRPAVSYADADPAASSSSNSTSIFDMYGPPVPSTSTSSIGGSRAEMGEKPPPGRIGRQMFERDTGASLGKSDEVEFEFSSGDEEDVSGADEERRSEGKRIKVEVPRNEQRERRGDENGRERGRGRGGSDNSARGRGRGRGGTQDRGGRGNSRGRGGRGGNRGGGGGERNVAPLPARASPHRSGGGYSSASPAGLPQRPTFDLPEGTGGGISEDRMSIDASQAPAFAPPIRFGEPTTFGGGPSSATSKPSNQSPVPQPRPNPRQPSAPPTQGYTPQMPYAGQSTSYPQQPSSYYRAPPPMHAPSQPYYPSSSFPSNPVIPNSTGGAYSPHQPSASFPPPPPQTGATPVGGHVNPRFLAQQQQQQQSVPPSAQNPVYQAGAYGYGNYGGYGGYGGGYNAGAGGYGQGGQGR
ncbi:hypothetical protein JCM5353_006435 [Sporobolomyces roseus]